VLLLRDRLLLFPWKPSEFFKRRHTIQPHPFEPTIFGV
jgi:hypothetical protein